MGNGHAAHDRQAQTEALAAPLTLAVKPPEGWNTASRKGGGTPGPSSSMARQTQPSASRQACRLMASRAWRTALRSPLRRA